MRKEKMGPVALQERIQTIDIIRGFALFGILVVNLTVDNPGVSPMQGRTGFFDQLVYWQIDFLLNDKFMAIFCFMFGLGFAIQMLRAKENKSNFIFVYMRRLIVLFLFGAFIKIFITGRGVLADYAMVGVLLLILYKLPRKILLVLALICVIGIWARDSIIQQSQIPSTNKKITVDTTILDTYVGVYPVPPKFNQIFIRKGNQLVGEAPGSEYRLIALSDSEFFRPGANVKITFMKDSTGNVDRYVSIDAKGAKTTRKKIKTDLQLAMKEQLKIRREMKFNLDTLTYKQFVNRNANRFWGWLKYWSWKDFFLGFNISYILPLFLLGLYAGRRQIFQNIPTNQFFLQNVMKWGLLIGMTATGITIGYTALNFINGNPNEIFYRTTPWYSLCWDLGVIIMALGIVASLTLLLAKPKWKKRFSFFIPVGRMGLTNYILLLAICDLFILGDYGFGLAGKIGPFWRLMIALPVFAFIVFISHWWFKRFRIGPAEWLWRSLTYLKVQPMRLKSLNKRNAKDEEGL
ncbi:MAG TPA: DUF418 domain-containing protein [Chitinophagaceae bacterium]|nr:DUF418 domain-containing protein [Chitinophagaceae bacterium]